MIPSFSFRLTPEEFLSETRQLRHPFMRWNWVGNVGMTVFGVLWLVVGIASLFLPPDPILPRWKQLLLIGMGVSAIGFFCIAPLAIAQRRRKTHEGALHFSVDQFGIVLATPAERVSRTWDQLTRVRRAVGGVLLDFVDTSYWVPRRVFATAQDFRDFVKSVESVRSVS